MARFIACGCVLENRTLFKGIQVLPPGSTWTFRGGTLEQRGTYFEPEAWEKQSPLDPMAYYQKLREVFSQNLPRYFNGNQPLGMSLTGGLDSRMILAWHKASPGSLPCYSFGGMFRDSQDVRLARRLAGACNQSHRVISVGDDFLSNFPRYAERSVYLTDGCLEVIHSPDLYVNERAREIAPVRMTGNYGGEVLRRVRAFKPVSPVAGLFRPEVLTHVQAAHNTYASMSHTHPLTFAVFRQAPWHHYGLLALEQTQLSLRSPFLDNDFVQTVFRAPDSALMNNDVCLRLIAEGDASLLQIRTDRGHAGNSGRPAGRNLSRRCSSSRSRRSMPTTMACPSGWRESITCFRPSIPNGSSWAATSSTIFESGTAMLSPSTCRKCCWTLAPSPGPTLSGVVSKPSCADTSKGTGTTLPRFTKS